MRSRSSASSSSRLWAFMRIRIAERCSRRAAMRSTTQAASSNSSLQAWSRTGSPPGFVARSVLPLRFVLLPTSAAATSRMRWLER
jgi:hypothetical protein